MNPAACAYRNACHLAKAQLKQKWGTMQRLLSSQSRLEKVIAGILLDMATRPRLADGHGNAMLVGGRIYEACKFYELFARRNSRASAPIVTSYTPTGADAKPAQAHSPPGTGYRSQSPRQRTGTAPTERICPRRGPLSDRPITVWPVRYIAC